MSAIASFELYQRSKLDDLRDAVVPKKRLFRAPKDTFHDYRGKHGRSVVDYDWSGYVLATLMPYLQQRHQIDLMHSEYNDLAAFMSAQRSATYFILTNEQKQSYLAQLSPELFSIDELRGYYNKFNATNDTQAGEPMLDGIRAVSQSLGHLDSDSVILLGIE